MADDLDLTEMFRRAVEANVKFYQGWLDLSLAYVRGLSDIFTEGEGNTGSVDSVQGSPEVGVLVLESEAGGPAQGAFLVTNDLTRTVSCQLVASQFSESGGKIVRPKVTFEPKAFQLEPGEQRVVQATIGVTRRLTAGLGYQGEFAIKGMEGLAVPVVLRRRHGSDEIPETPVAQAKAGRATATGEKTRRRPSPRKSAAKTVGSKTKGAGAEKAPRKRAARQKS